MRYVGLESKARPCGYAWYKSALLGMKTHLRHPSSTQLTTDRDQAFAAMIRTSFAIHDQASLSPPPSSPKCSNAKKVREISGRRNHFNIIVL